MSNSLELKNIRHVILSGVGEALSQHGFRARGEEFRRAQGSVIQGIVLDTAIYPEAGLSIGVSAAIRFPEVESIANGCGDGDRESWTIGSARYQSKKWHRIAQSKDARRVSAEVAQWAEVEGLGFLEKHSGASGISDVLAIDSEEAAILQPVPLARAIRSIVMGLLDRGPEVARGRIEYWRGELSEKHPAYLKWFEDWIKCFTETALSKETAN